MDNQLTIIALFQSTAGDLGFQIVLGEKNLCNIKRTSTSEDMIIELPHKDEMLSIYVVIRDVPFSH
jgi:serine protease inhibitor